jgi:hypothetical protein
MSDSAPPSERRRGTRHVARFPGVVEPPESEKMTAMISDLSETGALLLVRLPESKVGDELRIELHILFDSDDTHVVSGRVVRVEPLPDSRTGLWTHQLAVQFQESIAFTPAEIESLEKRKALLEKRRRSTRTPFSCNSLLP